MKEENFYKIKKVALFGIRYLCVIPCSFTTQNYDIMHRYLRLKAPFNKP